MHRLSILDYQQSGHHRYAQFLDQKFRPHPGTGTATVIASLHVDSHESRLRMSRGQRRKSGVEGVATSGGRAVEVDDHLGRFGRSFEKGLGDIPRMLSRTQLLLINAVTVRQPFGSLGIRGLHASQTPLPQFFEVGIGGIVQYGIAFRYLVLYCRFLRGGGTEDVGRGRGAQDLIRGSESKVHLIFLKIEVVFGCVFWSVLLRAAGDVFGLRELGLTSIDHAQIEHK